MGVQDRSDGLCVCLTGLQALEVIHVAEAEVAVGQNVSLPCIFNDTLDATISQMEWRLKPRIKLVVFHVTKGAYHNSHSLSLKFLTETGDANKLKGSYLQINNAQVNASGTYVCELVTYPHGSISRETRLRVRGKKYILNIDHIICMFNVLGFFFLLNYVFRESIAVGPNGDGGPGGRDGTGRDGVSPSINDCLCLHSTQTLSWCAIRTALWP